MELNPPNHEDDWDCSRFFGEALPHSVEIRYWDGTRNTACYYRLPPGRVGHSTGIMEFLETSFVGRSRTGGNHRHRGIRGCNSSTIKEAILKHIAEGATFDVAPLPLCLISNTYLFSTYASVIFCSFGSKTLIWKLYAFPSSKLSRSFSSVPNDEL